MARPRKVPGKTAGRPRKLKSVPERDVAAAASRNGKHTATVDGRDAVIDPRPPPLPAIETPTRLTELMNSLVNSQVVLESKTIEGKTAKEAIKFAQAQVNSLLAQVTIAWRDRDQLELPFTARVVDAEYAEAYVECASCHARAGTIPLANGAKWCVSCVQTALVEPKAETPIDAPAPNIEVVITALADALRADDARGHAAAAEKVAALSADPRELSEIRAELTRVASTFKYELRPEPPFVHKLEMAQA